MVLRPLAPLERGRPNDQSKPPPFQLTRLHPQVVKYYVNRVGRKRLVPIGSPMICYANGDSIPPDHDAALLNRFLAEEAHRLGPYSKYLYDCGRALCDFVNFMRLRQQSLLHTTSEQLKQFGKYRAGTPRSRKGAYSKGHQEVRIRHVKRFIRLISTPTTLKTELSKKPDSSKKDIANRQHALKQNKVVQSLVCTLPLRDQLIARWSHQEGLTARQIASLKEETVRDAFETYKVAPKPIEVIGYRDGDPPISLDVHFDLLQATYEYITKERAAVPESAAETALFLTKHGHPVTDVFIVSRWKKLARRQGFFHSFSVLERLYRLNRELERLANP